MFIFKKPSQKAARRQSSRKVERTCKRQRTFEALEARQLMAADINLTSGVLFVDGTSFNDNISADTVWSTGFQGKSAGSSAAPITKIVRINVETDMGKATQEQSAYYEYDSVDEIRIEAFGGNDEVEINLDLPTIIDGGSGADVIYGGQNRDVIDGGSGNDHIYGRRGIDTLTGGPDADHLFGGADQDVLNGNGGADVLEGGAGPDTLSGGKGNDTLRGDDGNDTLSGGKGLDTLEGGSGEDLLRGGPDRDFLRGGDGDDVLVGDDGNDDLMGDDGNDSLISGSGSDNLLGNYGIDRFLVLTQQPANLIDFDNSDVRINFENSNSVLARADGSTAAPQNWRNEEMLQVDEAFGLLFNATGNAALLAKPNGQEFRFVRHGTLIKSDGTTSNVAGQNDGQRITLFQQAFTDFLTQTVIHEVGHHFDAPGENEHIDDFRDLAGWRNMNGMDRFFRNMGNYEQASEPDSKWYYESGHNGFARAYGRENPREDFATSFAAKVMTDSMYSYDAGSEFSEYYVDVQARMTDRFEILDDFFASLS